MRSFAFTRFIKRTPRPSSREQGLVSVPVPAPGAGVEVLLWVGVGVALHQLDVSLLAPVDCHPIEAHGGEYDGCRPLVLFILDIANVVVDRTAKQRLVVVLLPVTYAFEMGFCARFPSSPLPLLPWINTRLSANK